MVEPVIPDRTQRPKGGRPPISNRAALTRIIFVLKTGTPWKELPQEMGCGSGIICWRRLKDWQQAGVWEKILYVMLQHLHDTKKIDHILRSGYFKSVNIVFKGNVHMITFA